MALPITRTQKQTVAGEENRTGSNWGTLLGIAGGATLGVLSAGALAPVGAAAGAAAGGAAAGTAAGTAASTLAPTILAGVGGATAGGALGGTVGGMFNSKKDDRVVNSPSGQVPVSEGAISRRLSAMQGDSLATLQNSLMALPKLPDELRKEYASPLLQAYQAEAQKRMNGGVA